MDDDLTIHDNGEPDEPMAIDASGLLSSVFGFAAGDAAKRFARAARRDARAARRAENLPRANTPKAERRKAPVETRVLSEEGIRRLGHAPRSRKLGQSGRVV